MTWTSIKEGLPSLTQKQKRAESFGKEVLVYSPDDNPSVFMAFYGRRVTAKPNFYLHGAVLHGVTHWMDMPAPPSFGEQSSNWPPMGSKWKEIDGRYDTIIKTVIAYDLRRGKVQLLGGMKTWAKVERFNGKAGGYVRVE